MMKMCHGGAGLGNTLIHATNSGIASAGSGAAHDFQAADARSLLEGLESRWPRASANGRYGVVFEAFLPAAATY